MNKCDLLLLDYELQHHYPPALLEQFAIAIAIAIAIPWTRHDFSKMITKCFANYKSKL
jgi:hypothetical protein